MPMQANAETSIATATNSPTDVGWSSTTFMALMVTKKLRRAAPMWTRWSMPACWSRSGSTAGARGWDAGGGAMASLVEGRSRFLRSHDKMDHAVRCGDEEAVKIFVQLLDFVAPRDAMNFQK